MNAIKRLFFNTIAIIIVAELLPGIFIENLVAAIALTVVLTLLNTFVKPILVLISIPISVLTLGLFLLIINTLMIVIADFFIEGFRTQGFGWALIFGLLSSIISSIMVRAFK